MLYGYHFYDETGKWFRSENRHDIERTFQLDGHRYYVLESIQIDREFHLKVQRVEVT